MLIRDAVAADLPVIVSIYNSTIDSRRVTADLQPVSTESKIFWFEAHNSHTRPLWVVIQNDEIIAWVSFQDFYGRPAYRHTAEISIYIHAGYRQQGLGKYLLEYALSKCPQMQIKTLLGFIFGHNEPSIRLFGNTGFTVWGQLPGVAELDGIERDLIILGKHI
jgi:phosphinothricin acetyltransferase